MSTPSLLNIPYLYKAGTLYSQIPESGAGDFTVSRTTTVANRSTRINKDGFIETVLDNVPRLDYPLGGAVNGCPALLVEPSAENLLFYSEEFDNGYWFKNTTTVQINAAISPRNTLTADNIYPNSTGADRRFQRAVSIVSGTTYTFSIFAKANGLNWIRFSSPQFNLFAWFNVQSGTIGTVQAGVTARIENYGNGWYRCSVTQTATSTTTGQFYINPTDGDNTSNVTASGTNGVLFWGAQGEIGTVATSYIPTTTAAITRGEDRITKTGITSLIGQTEGTFYFEGEANFASSDLPMINRSVTNSVLLVKNVSNQLVVYVYYGGVFLPVFTTPSAITGPFKVAVGYKQGSPGDTAVFVNGVQVGTTNTTSWAFTGALTEVIVRAEGYLIGGKPYKVRALGVYPNRLSNSQLQALTT